MLLWIRGQLTSGLHQRSVKANFFVVSSAHFISNLIKFPNSQSDVYSIEIKNRFNSNASSTYKSTPDDPTFELEYNIGKVSGVRAKETVAVIEIGFIYVFR